MKLQLLFLSLAASLVFSENNAVVEDTVEDEESVAQPGLAQLQIGVLKRAEECTSRSRFG